MSFPARVILHLDMDAFFAQAEVLAAPALRGMPLVVGGIPGSRGVVATASYEARRFGIRSGMSLAEAVRRCPDAVFLPCHPSRYFDLSARLLKLLLGVTPAVEMASIDEAYLDATQLVQDGELARYFPKGVGRANGLDRGTGRDPVKEIDCSTGRDPARGLDLTTGRDPALEIERERARHLSKGINLALEIQARVRETIGLSCSIGVGECKLIAKMAAGIRKPGGITCLDREGFRLKFHPQPVSVLYGIGKATVPKLERLGIRTIGDLASYPERKLQELFGVWGPMLRAAARGEEQSPVVPYHERPEAKSIGHEYTLPRDEEDRAELRKTLLGLCDEVASDLRGEGWKAGSIHIRIRWSDWVLISRQCGLSSPADSAGTLFRAGWRLFERNDAKKPVRLLGITATHLVSAKRVVTSADLFETDEDVELDRALDRLRESFGRGVLERASLLRPHSRRHGGAKRISPWGAPSL